MLMGTAEDDNWAGVRKLWSTAAHSPSQPCRCQGLNWRFKPLLVPSHANRDALNKPEALTPLFVS
jgi:hypothetical protein